jgi:hypothetical protein
MSVVMVMISGVAAGTLEGGSVGAKPARLLGFVNPVNRRPRPGKQEGREDRRCGPGAFLPVHASKVR